LTLEQLTFLTKDNICQQQSTPQELLLTTLAL